jgi:hypothetical protein
MALLLALIPGLAMADNAIMEELGNKAAKAAMQNLEVDKGNVSILILSENT